MTVYHVSEEPGIALFEPRPIDASGESLVWAIDDSHLRNYLVPRECPRVTFGAGPRTTDADRERFLGVSRAVVAIETDWFERVQSRRLFCHHLPDEAFTSRDESAGYFVSLGKTPIRSWLTGSCSSAGPCGPLARSPVESLAFATSRSGAGFCAWPTSVRLLRRSSSRST
jgi:hypothetical protein